MLKYVENPRRFRARQMLHCIWIFVAKRRSISAAAASAALCRARSAAALRKKKRLFGLILGAVWGILTMWAR
jgi:hypothetical protein